jgi:pimeloyl-ACP methyl ester carboxylesterase
VISSTKTKNINNRCHQLTNFLITARAGMGNIVTKAAFLPPSRDLLSLGQYENWFIWLTSEYGHVFPVYHFVHSQQAKTILFSHGNAEDVPAIIPLMENLGSILEVNVVAYEYSGYSFSRRSSTDHRLPSPRESYCYANALATYDYLTKDKGINPNDIIVMGRSLGSGPATELAIRRPVGGLILQCPLLSAVRVVMKTLVTLPMDIFANIDKIHKVQCPVLIIHGTADRVINVEHGKKLFELVKHPNKLSLWIEGADHNDIELNYLEPYIRKLQEFLQMVNTRNQNLSNENNTNVDKT